jgi:hypothetical protein
MEEFKEKEVKEEQKPEVEAEEIKDNESGFVSNLS